MSSLLALIIKCLLWGNYSQWFSIPLLTFPYTLMLEHFHTSVEQTQLPLVLNYIFKEISKLTSLGDGDNVFFYNTDIRVTAIAKRNYTIFGLWTKILVSSIICQHSWHGDRLAYKWSKMVDSSKFLTIFAMIFMTGAWLFERGRMKASLPITRIWEPSMGIHSEHFNWMYGQLENNGILPMAWEWGQSYCPEVVVWAVESGSKLAAWTVTGCANCLYLGEDSWPSSGQPLV